MRRKNQLRIGIATIIISLAHIFLNLIQFQVVVVKAFSLPMKQNDMSTIRKPNEVNQIIMSSINNDNDDQPLVTFGVLADIQYAPIPDGFSYNGKARYYRHALDAAKHAAKHFEEENVDLVINLGDIIDNTINLRDFRGLVFVGGFSFSDVLGSAYGWYNSIINNSKVKEQFDNFYLRNDTFSLGVCNGCQLMSLLGWVENISLEHNNSGRFESRYSFVKILENNSIFLKDMEDLTIGIWVAHGEGKIYEKSENNNTYPIKYIDDKSNITEKYPFNPNGSKEGNAAICSSNGRHLALMPHPERCVLNWQLPWVSKNERNRVNDLGKTAWMNIFYNAYNWCNNL